MRFNVIIIHPDTRMSKIIAERLTAYGCKIRAIGQTAEEAYVLCRTCPAEVLFMAAELPDANCDAVTARLEREITHPLIKIAHTDIDNHTLSDRFYNYGGDLFLHGPADYAYCVEVMHRFYRLRCRQGTPLNPNPLIRGCTRKHLIRMEMPTNVRGFVYLLDAVELLAQDPSLQHNLVQGLYADIGILHQAPYTNIERCIRTAVEKAFELGDINYIYRHFGTRVQEKTGKTKNGDFIEILAQIVLEDLRLWQ